MPFPNSSLGHLGGGCVLVLAFLDGLARREQGYLLSSRELGVLGAAHRTTDWAEQVWSPEWGGWLH